MKRTLCLLLCLLMLFCIGCKNEEPEQTPQLNKGTFYMSDGKQYNTHVKIKLTSTDLTTAATTLSVEVQNDTDYVILIRDDPEKLPWEKFENGQWIKVPPIPYGIDENGDYPDIAFKFPPLLPRSTTSKTNEFTELEAGSYRLRVTVDVTDVQSPLAPGEDYKLSAATRCIAELRFDIVPG